MSLTPGPSPVAALTPGPSPVASNGRGESGVRFPLSRASARERGLGGEGLNPETENIRLRLTDPSIDGLWLRERLMPRLADGSGTRPRTPPPGAPTPRHGAVLVLLYPLDGELNMPLTVRNAALRDHSGEVSLPGGGFDPEDSDLAQTALREAWEELAVPPASVELWTALTPVWIPVSNFQVTPFVGYTATRPPFDPATREVAELIETPLSLLLREDAIRETERDVRGRFMTVPYFAVGDHVVWGATSLVLAELAGKLLPR